MLALALAACGAAQKQTPAGPPPGAESDTNTPAPPAPPLANAQPPTPTAYAAELAKIGLDPKDLPAIDKVPPEQLRQTMKLIAKSLGVRCTVCHDFTSDQRSKRMNVAEGMWNHFTRELQTKSGEPIFCDSCHHGSLSILDRRDQEAVALWMDENYVAKLTRKDGKEHACPTCHGEPAEMHFIPIWAARKAFPTFPPQVVR